MEGLGVKFTCEVCKETLYSARTDEAAMQEAVETFTQKEMSHPAGMAVVCTDCWRKMGFDYDENGKVVKPPLPKNFAGGNNIQ